MRDRSQYGAALCQGLAAHALDQLVTQQALLALEPAALELSLQVAEDLEAERARLDDNWRQKLERVQYEADRARRQFDAVEPENRLVARTLEKAWEEKLSQHRQIEEEYTRVRARQPRLLTAQERLEIQRLAADIPSLWHAKTTTNSQRREILRQLVERVTVTVEGATEQMSVSIAWAGGHQSTLQGRRPVAKFEQLSYGSQLLDRVSSLRKAGCNASAIAKCLNDEGLRPPKRREAFSRDMVRSLLYRHELSPIRRARTEPLVRLKRNEWWLPTLAAHLQMPVVTMYFWVRRGWLHARQLDGKQGRWIAWADSAEVERFRRLRARKPQQWTDEPPPDATRPPRPPGW